jgi:tRNA(Ile)-lysidine synthase
MDLLAQLTQNIRTQKLFQKGETVIVGLSGGPDSMTLLDALYQVRQHFSQRLIVAHFNHNCRRASKLDELFSRRRAEHYGLIFHSEVWASPPDREKDKGSWENLARDARTRFFKKISRRYKATAVALAHTRDDVAETVLMRILRGTGLRGLRSIQPCSERDGLRWIRPLCAVSKQQCLAYLTSRKIPYRRDPTNQQDIFFRNKIRNKLIPLLEEHYSPGIQKHLVQLAGHAADDYACLEKLACRKLAALGAEEMPKKRINLDRTKWQRLDAALQNMTLQLAASRLLDGRFAQIKYSDFRLLTAELNGPARKIRFQLPHRLELVATGERITLARPGGRP